MSFTSRVGYAIRHPGSILLWLERAMKRRAINPSEGFFGNALLDGLMTYGGTAVLFLVMSFGPLFLGIELRESMNPSLLKMAQWASLIGGGIMMFMWTYFWIFVYSHRFDRIMVCVPRDMNAGVDYGAEFYVEPHVDDPADGTASSQTPDYMLALCLWRHAFFGPNRRKGLQYTVRGWWGADLVVQDRVGAQLHMRMDDADRIGWQYLLRHLVTDLDLFASGWQLEYSWRLAMAALVKHIAGRNDSPDDDSVTVDPEPLSPEVLELLRSIAGAK